MKPKQLSVGDRVRTSMGYIGNVVHIYSDGERFNVELINGNVLNHLPRSNLRLITPIKPKAVKPKIEIGDTVYVFEEELLVKKGMVTSFDGSKIWVTSNGCAKLCFPSQCILVDKFKSEEKPIEESNKKRLLPEYLFAFTYRKESSIICMEIKATTFRNASNIFCDQLPEECIISVMKIGKV